MILRAVLLLLAGTWVTTLALLYARGRWYGPLVLAAGMIVTVLAALVPGLMQR